MAIKVLQILEDLKIGGMGYTEHGHGVLKRRARYKGLVPVYTNRALYGYFRIVRCMLNL